MNVFTDKAIREFGGRITARNDEGTQVRVEFPYVGKAQNFVRVMRENGTPAKRLNPTSPKAVVITV